MKSKMLIILIYLSLSTIRINTLFITPKVFIKHIQSEYFFTLYYKIDIKQGPHARTTEAL